MRSLSGTRNRIALTVAGLLTLAVAAWLVAVSFALIPAGSPLAGLTVPADSTVSMLVQEHRGWALPAATAASVLAVLAGLGLLLAQIPTAPAHTSLRLHDDDGTVLATLEPQVLERALAERVEGVPGVEEASVRVSGSTTSLRILAEVTIAEEAQVEWAVEEARRVLAADPETALGTSPRSVDLLVRVHTPRTSRSDRVAVRHHGAGGELVSEAA
ncbi:MAG: hypothetical protein Q7T31_01535 [Dietzia sp.]|uniref:Alkaline shock response membrane anchor protein AmaP n=4 Tax=Dietzia TaxID=37914 RepID=A0A2A2WQM7_9ACTN|nr:MULTISPECIES: hypothetical protein [Dietzia]MBB1042477.1 hypothetical protein [Dietzia sp. Cai40]MCT1515404.1 hypothetical protein [Dietzia cercidiphylli]MDO8393055.1 hypothetical protein [Dietzia sp.]PAY23274.1 hypothetical protein CEY15_09525 [Dietzia natronolimnaea]